MARKITVKKHRRLPPHAWHLPLEHTQGQGKSMCWPFSWSAEDTVTVKNYGDLSQRPLRGAKQQTQRTDCGAAPNPQPGRSWPTGRLSRFWGTEEKGEDQWPRPAKTFVYIRLDLEASRCWARRPTGQKSPSVVDVYLDETGRLPPAWHLDASTSVEAEDHYDVELTTDA